MSQQKLRVYCDQCWPNVCRVSTSFKDLPVICPYGKKPNWKSIDADLNNIAASILQSKDGQTVAKLAEEAGKKAALKKGKELTAGDKNHD